MCVFFPGSFSTWKIHISNLQRLTKTHVFVITQTLQQGSRQFAATIPLCGRRFLPHATVNSQRRCSKVRIVFQMCVFFPGSFPSWKMHISNLQPLTKTPVFVIQQAMCVLIPETGQGSFHKLDVWLKCFDNRHISNPKTSVYQNVFSLLYL